MKFEQAEKEGGRPMPGGRMEFVAPDVDAAVRMAADFKARGLYKYFRGQNDASWEVTSSYARLDEMKRQHAFDEFCRFRDFVVRSPEFVGYLQNEDAIIATAQHHQLAATTFIDFSTSPEVAGWFASNDRGEKPTHGAIFMVDDEAEDTFQAFDDDRRRLRFLFPDVPNHWRMQAQYGLFLEAQVNIAEIWPLDRVVFPHRDGPSAIDRRHIYPDRKSALELAIDQYLLQRKRNEDFSSFMAGVDKSKVAFIQIREDASKVDVTPQIPPAWAGGARENWSDVDVDSVRPEGSIEQVGGDTAYLLDLITRRRRCTDLVQLTGPGSERLQVLLDRLWAGCRPHPYDELQLVRAVSALFSIYDALRERNLASGQALAAGAAEVYAEPLEIGISASGDNPTRAFVDAVRLEESLKPDVRASYLGRADTAADRMKLLLQERWEIPWSTFDESSLVELFVDQIIPWQLVSGRNPVAFSPFEVRRVGLA